MSDFEKLINANDLIEWIMETYPDWCVGAVRSIVDHVENMPSAEPDTIEKQESDIDEAMKLVRDARVTILPSAEPVRCKDCRWGREVCGNIECFVDSNMPEYHGYEWFCPNGERKQDATS